MSRVGRAPIKIIDGIDVVVNDQVVLVKGKRGEQSLSIPNGVDVKIADSHIIVGVQKKDLHLRKLWGSIRSLLNNMVIGLSEGFVIKLEIVGVGFRAAVQGKELVMNLGFSHDVRYLIPEGIKITCPDQTHIDIEGASKELVGKVAANIRHFKKPEPYKGKGIRFVGERVRSKEGKKK